MEIGILGPLEVRADGRIVQIAGARLRALLTRLAVEAPTTVSTAELVDALWPGDPPNDPVNALQSLISRVRRLLGDPAAVLQVVGGYRLAVEREAVDAAAFSALVGAGRRELRDGADATARDTLAKALSLWRGPPLVDAGDAGYAAAPRVRLQDQLLGARTDMIEAELRLGRGVDVIGDLESLVAANPLRERLAGQLMRALAAAGRTADALGVFDRLRAHLADELGVDPGPEVQALQLAVLRGEIEPEVMTTPASGRRHSNLRASLTSFIGREDELARVSTLLESGRLVTIVGPGGAGKTRLASEVAARWISRRSDGVWLIELAPVSDGKAIAQAMLGALGLLDTRSVDRRLGRAAPESMEQLFDVLAEADCLLLVDNCEHLIGPVAALVDQLLARCPEVRILTTSREPLGIVGESLCVLPPLGLPPVGVAARDAADHPAVQLLIERAQAVHAGFAVDDSTVDDIVEIVQRLDGLPLAIELAAARLRVMPIGEIAARLSDRFRLLTGGSRTAMPRHRTLRAVVEWSWDLLAPDERLLAELLAVFPAGATVDSACAVCGDDRLPAADIGELLLSLVDKSLLTTVGASPVRYRMLETIREYGAEQLTERGEAQAARIAHARYFALVAARADPVLRTSDQLRALATLNVERDNILAGLRYLVESDDAEDRLAGLDLALSLTWYWTMNGADSESATWLGLALAAVEGDDHPNRAWARSARALSAMQNELANPDVTLEQVQGELRVLSRELADAPVPENTALVLLAPMLAFFGGDLERAESLMVAALHSTDGWVRAATRATRAFLAENEGHLVDMRAEIDSAYKDFAAIGDRWGLSSVLTARGSVRTMDGDHAGAIEDYERALRYANELGSSDDGSLIQLRLAGLQLRAGDLAEARRTVEAVRDAIANRSQGIERGMFADGVLMTIVLFEGDLEAATSMAEDARRRVALSPTSFIHGHMSASVGGLTAQVAIRGGDLATAMADLRTAYPVAVSTRDMPIVAGVGVSVADLAAALDRPADAAVILGAAARLRGSDDRGDPRVADLTALLQRRLGREFDDAYASGKSLGRAEAIARLDPALLGGAPASAE